MDTMSSRVEDDFRTAMMASLPTGVLSIDERGRIVFASPSVEPLLGYRPERLLETPIDRLVPADRASTIEQIYRNAASETTDRTASELTLVDSDDTELHVRVSASEFTYDGRPFFTVTFRPRDTGQDRQTIYESGSRSQEPADYKHHLESLVDGSRRLMAAETKGEIAEIVIEIVQTVLDRSLTALWIADDDAERLRPVAASEAVGGLPADDRAAGLRPIEPGTTEMAVFYAGEPVLLDEYSDVETPAHPELPLQQRLAVPIGGHGLLGVGSTTADGIDPAIEDLVEVLARMTEAAFDRLDRERTTRQQSAAMDAVPDGIGILDPDGEFIYVNDALATLSDVDAETLVGTPLSTLYNSEMADRIASEALPAVRREGHWRGVISAERDDETTIQHEVSITSLDAEYAVCVVRDVSAQIEHKQQLEALNAVAHELMAAETPAEIAVLGVDAIAEVVGVPTACVRLLDAERRQLDPVALTPAAEALLDSQVAYDLESTLAGRAYREGAVVSTVESLAGETAPASVEFPSVHVPIGAYGVVSLVAADDIELTDRDVRLTELLSVTLRSAIERAEGTSRLRKQERELRAQRDQLEATARINALIRLIERHLVEASTKAELEAAICEQLASSELYASAWIGDLEVATDRINPQFGAGIRQDDLDAIGDQPLSGIGHGTVAEAIETGEMQVLRQHQFVGSTSHDDEQAAHIKTTAAVPIVHHERCDGVLVINCLNGCRFDETIMNGFELLGKITGFALHAIRNREILLSDSIVELSFEVTDPELFYIQVTAEFDCSCEFRRSIPVQNGQLMHYHRIAGAEPAAVVEFADEFDHVDSARAVAEDDDGFVLQTVTDASPADRALQAGATYRTAVSEDGTGRLVIEAPQSADIRGIVAALEDVFATVDLRSKREHERAIETATEVHESVEGALTNKQQAAVEAAFFAGYYNWPREITAEELSELMGISSSTLHQHLRNGIREILTVFVNEDGR